MEHKGTVLLTTPRLTLRRLSVEDAQTMHQNWASDPGVTKYLMWQPHPNVEATRAFLAGVRQSYADEATYQWGIELRESKILIGTISAVELKEEIGLVHIGYCIGKSWWGCGYVAEALKELIRFFFTEVGVNKVEARHDPRNPNSGRVMQKAGLRYEGTLRACDRNNQGICDAAYYGLLRSEWIREQGNAE